MRLILATKKTAVLITFSFFAFSFLFSFLGNPVHAQTAGATCTNGKSAGDAGYCSLTTIPGVFDSTKTTDPVEVVKKIYGISIGIGAILAVIMIIWAGIQYATTEAITGKSDAKERWQGALWGLTLLLASYLILRTINVDLVNINLKDLLNNPIKCTPTKDASGKEIPCGVSSDSLENIFKAANESAVSYQRALQAVNDTQKSLNELKAEHKKLSDQWIKKNMLTDEGRLASARLLELENKIKTSEQATLSAQIESKLESIKNRSFSAFGSVTSKAISHGEIAIAQKSADTAKRLMRDDLTALQNLKVPADKIKMAVDQVNAASNILDMIITVGRTLQSDSPSRTKNRIYFGFNSPVASERKKLVENAIPGGDINKQHIDSILGAFDYQIAKKLNCSESKGISIQSDNSITCKQ